VGPAGVRAAVIVHVDGAVQEQVEENGTENKEITVLGDQFDELSDHGYILPGVLDENPD
jgi:hypothetical protein